MFIDSELVRYSRTPTSFFDNANLPDTRAGCFTVGMFQRTAPSDELKEGLDRILWKTVKPIHVAILELFWKNISHILHQMNHVTALILMIIILMNGRMLETQMVLQLLIKSNKQFMIME